MNWKPVTTLLLKKLLILKKMKLSNKLLIAFASSLIVIPLLGMVIVSATQYKKGTYQQVDQKIENFSTPTKNMVSIDLKSSFQSINIADGKRLVLKIQLIKDDKFGIKVPNEFKELVSTAVDANGQLKISVKNFPNEDREGRSYYLNILVYAPNVNALTVDGANDLIIAATSDSLTLNVKNTETIGFEGDTKIKSLKLNTIDVNSINFRENNIESVNLKLFNTNLSMEGNSFENVSITSAGNCTIEIRGGDNKDKKNSIKNLALNTSDFADVKFENMEIANCTGKLSDKTLVQMPAVNLNQMYKK